VGAKEKSMSEPQVKRQTPKSYVVSLENRKARGSGHERAAEILCAARDLFLEHGVENVTTRQIAARVGISQTALYVYFPSKESMLDRLSLDAFAKLNAAFGALKDKGLCGGEYFRQSAREYIRFGLEHPDEYRLMFIVRARRRDTLLPGHPERGSVRAIVFDRLQEKIADGVTRGALRDFPDPRAAAQSVWAALHGLVSLFLCGVKPDWAAIEPLVDLHVDIVLNGLVKAPAPAPATVVSEAVLQETAATAD
jgi:AcrR family transcriptional regulator